MIVFCAPFHRAARRYVSRGLLALRDRTLWLDGAILVAFVVKLFAVAVAIQVATGLTYVWVYVFGYAHYPIVMLLVKRSLVGSIIGKLVITLATGLWGFSYCYLGRKFFGARLGRVLARPRLRKRISVGTWLLWYFLFSLATLYCCSLFILGAFSLRSVF